MSTNQDHASANGAARTKRRDCWMVMGLGAALLAAWVVVLVGMLRIAAIDAGSSADAREAAPRHGATEQKDAVR